MVGEFHKGGRVRNLRFLGNQGVVAFTFGRPEDSDAQFFCAFPNKLNAMLGFSKGAGFHQEGPSAVSKRRLGHANSLVSPTNRTHAYPYVG